jgi:glutaredoxin-related protein
VETGSSLRSHTGHLRNCMKFKEYMGFEVTFSPTSLRKSGENIIKFYSFIYTREILSRKSTEVASILCRFCVDSLSILRRFCVDFASILCRFSVDSLSILCRFVGQCPEFISARQDGRLSVLGPLFWPKIVGVRDK